MDWVLARIRDLGAGWVLCVRAFLCGCAWVRVRICVAHRSAVCLVLAVLDRNAAAKQQRHA